MYLVRPGAVGREVEDEIWTRLNRNLNHCKVDLDQRSLYQRTEALGLAAIELKPQNLPLRQALREFLDWCAWHPAFPVSELAKEGRIHLRPLPQEALTDVPEARE